MCVQIAAAATAGGGWGLSSRVELAGCSRCERVCALNPGAQARGPSWGGVKGESAGLCLQSCDQGEAQGSVTSKGAERLRVFTFASQAGSHTTISGPKRLLSPSTPFT